MEGGGKEWRRRCWWQMEVLVGKLRAAMKANVEEVSWMDARTRSAALLKLSRMGQKIGYPDYIHNETRIMQDYGGVPALSFF